jgi:peptidoglycan/LPS O-acetylase OafA/YrhL
VRVEELTFLRFIAAAIVVVFHYGRDSTGFSGVLTSGPEMVTFFFVLSGFVRGVGEKKKTTPLNTYLWARVSRIVPVYLLALSIFVAIDILTKKNVDAVSLALNLTLLQSWISPYPLSLNGPGWSLSVEAFFYISFPFILYHVKKYSLTSAQLGAASFVLWFLTHAITTNVLNNYYSGFPSFSHDMVFYFPLTHLCSFLFGLAGAVWILENKCKPQNKAISNFSLIVVLSVIVLILNNKGVINHFLENKLAFGSSLLSPIFILLIVLVALNKSSYIKLLSFYPLVLLGEASYSLYILQYPVHRIYNLLISDRLALSEHLDFYVFFIFLTLVSLCTFFLFEKPTNKFLRYFLPYIISNQLTKASSGRAKSARR